MMAYPLGEQSTIPEASFLDVMPWLTSLTQADLPYELAMASVFIDPISNEYFKADYDEEMSWSHVSLKAAFESPMSDVYQQLVADFWSMPTDKFEKHSRLVMESYQPAQPIWDDEPYTFLYMGYMAYGANWEHPEWTAPHSLENVLSIFGLELNDDNDNYYSVDYLDKAGDHDHARYLACLSLIQSLESSSDYVHQNIAVLLQWAFCNTGNTLFDMSYEGLAENGYEYFGWEHLDFADFLQSEADDLYDQFEKAREALNTDPILLNALAVNYETALRTIKATSDTNKINTSEYLNETTHHNTYTWPAYSGTSDTVITKAQSYAEHLRFWRDAPPE